MREVEFETEYGPVGVAVRQADDYGQEDVSRIQDLIMTGLSLQDSLLVVKPMAEALLAQVAGLGSQAGHRLETVSAELGLEVGGKGRFVVAEAEATAAVKVTLTWKFDH